MAIAMSKTDKQSTCLETSGGVGSMYILDYDRMSPAVRKRLSQSPFNLCAACVRIRANREHHLLNRSGRATDEGFICAIEKMESLIRAG